MKASGALPISGRIDLPLDVNDFPLERLVEKQRSSFPERKGAWEK